MWIEHDGSEWPKHAKPEDRVVVRFRDGDETVFYRPVSWWHGTSGPLGSNWYWDHCAASISSEIVAYRVKPQ